MNEPVNTITYLEHPNDWESVSSNDPEPLSMSFKVAAGGGQELQCSAEYNPSPI